MYRVERNYRNFQIVYRRRSSRIRIRTREYFIAYSNNVELCRGHGRRCYSGQSTRWRKSFTILRRSPDLDARVTCILTV